MPVPSSGQLKLRGNGDGTGIAEEVDGSVTGTNVSLAQVSITAEFSAPHGMGEFYGYTSNAAATSVYIRDNYGQPYTSTQSPCGGTTITFTCNVVDDDKTGANYKFYRNGSLVQNGSSASYATSASSTTYNIYCKYTDAGGISVDSSTWSQGWGGSQLATYRGNYGVSNFDNSHSSANCGAFPGAYFNGMPSWSYQNLTGGSIPSGVVHASQGYSGITPSPIVLGATTVYAGSTSPGQSRTAPSGGNWTNPTSTHVSQRARLNMGIGGGGCSYIRTATSGQTVVVQHDD